MGTIVVKKCGLVAAAAMMGMFAMSANASEAVLLHAAGSLRGALSEISQAFEKSLGLKVQAKFGPSGLLKDEIAAGAQSRRVRLGEYGTSDGPGEGGQERAGGPVCAKQTVRAGSPGPRRDHRYAARAHARSRKSNWQHRPRKPIRPATMHSRPFARRRPFGPMRVRRWRRRRCNSPAGPPAPRCRPGAIPTAGISPKAGPISSWPIAPPRAMRGRKIPDLQTIALPDALAVSADYGLTVTNDASPGAYRFALFILSSEGQRILASHGFSAPGLSE